MASSRGKHGGTLDAWGSVKQHICFHRLFASLIWNEFSLHWYLGDCFYMCLHNTCLLCFLWVILYVVRQSSVLLLCSGHKSIRLLLWPALWVYHSELCKFDEGNRMREKEEGVIGIWASGSRSWRIQQWKLHLSSGRLFHFSRLWWGKCKTSCDQFDLIWHSQFWILISILHRNKLKDVAATCLPVLHTVSACSSPAP